MALIFSVVVFTIQVQATELIPRQDELHRIQLPVAAEDLPDVRFNDYEFDIEQSPNTSVQLCYVGSETQEELLKLILEKISSSAHNHKDVLGSPTLRAWQLWSIFTRSMRGGKMDFYMYLRWKQFCDAGNLYDDNRRDFNTLTVIQMPDNGEAIAFNAHDLGNFMWGAAMKLIGVHRPVSRSGAHVNSLVFSRRDNPTVKIGAFDSKADQRAIKLGYRWARYFIKNKTEI